MSRPIRLLVLGLGNLLCSDDGAGAAAIEHLLASYDLPEGVSVLDGGTLGLSLLPYLEDAEHAILLDAVAADAPAGTLVRFEGDEVPRVVAQRLSPHQVGVGDLLEAARWRDRYPARLILLGLVPATLDLGLARSPAVEAQIPRLVERALEEARALGFAFRSTVRPRTVPA